jgi:hypothetical protein
MTADPKIIVTWVLALVVPVAAAIVLAGFLTLIPSGFLLDIVKGHFAAIVGLPVSAVFSVFLVVVLQQTSGVVKFEGLGFKFEGTSGQVVLWVLCFLAIAVAIRYGRLLQLRVKLPAVERIVEPAACRRSHKIPSMSTRERH